jgi:hypothetical protein
MAEERAVTLALSAWREAERTLAEATPGSPQSVDAAIAVDHAHRAYADAMDERMDTAAQLGRTWSLE